jgi:hypothetical protein
MTDVELLDKLTLLPVAEKRDGDMELEMLMLDGYDFIMSWVVVKSLLNGLQVLDFEEDCMDNRLCLYCANRRRCCNRLDPICRSRENNYLRRYAQK